MKNILLAICLALTLVSCSEEEKEIVKIIYKKFVKDDWSYIDIVRYLNEMGIRTKNNNLFQSKTIKYILSNQFYNGCVVWNRRNKNGTYKDKSEWIKEQGDFSILITNDLFEKAKKKIELLEKVDKKNSKPPGTYKHYLTGLLRCGCCGGTMSFRSYRNGKNRYYRCRKSTEGACTNTKGIKVEKLEEDILTKIDYDFRNVELIVSDVDTFDDSELDMYNNQLERIKKKFSQAKKAFLAEIDTIEEYKNNKEEFKKEEARISNKIQILNENSNDNKIKLVHGKLQDIKSIMENDKLPIVEKSKVLKSFIKQIIVDIPNDEMTIEYYLSEVVDEKYFKK